MNLDDMDDPGIQEGLTQELAPPEGIYPDMANCGRGYTPPELIEDLTENAKGIIELKGMMQKMYPDTDMNGTVNPLKDQARYLSEIKEKLMNPEVSFEAGRAKMMVQFHDLYQQPRATVKAEIKF